MKTEAMQDIWDSDLSKAKKYGQDNKK